MLDGASRGWMQDRRCRTDALPGGRGDLDVGREYVRGCTRWVQGRFCGCLKRRARFVAIAAQLPAGLSLVRHAHGELAVRTTRGITRPWSCHMHKSQTWARVAEVGRSIVRVDPSLSHSKDHCERCARGSASLCPSSWPLCYCQVPARCRWAASGSAIGKRGSAAARAAAVQQRRRFTTGKGVSIDRGAKRNLKTANRRAP